MNPRFKTIIRAVLLHSRWILAPFFLGLFAALLVILAQFYGDLARAVIGFAERGSGELIVTVLKLIDLVLIANLILMIIGAGIGIFAPDSADSGKELVERTAIVDFNRLKLKVFASISAIAAVDLLETSISSDVVDTARALVEILILLAFVVSGLLLAWTDRLSAKHD